MSFWRLWSKHPAKEPKAEGRDDLRLHLGWITVLTVALIVGFIVVLAYGFAQEQFNLGIAFLLSGGCVMLGDCSVFCSESRRPCN